MFLELRNIFFFTHQKYESLCILVFFPLLRFDFREGSSITMVVSDFLFLVRQVLRKMSVVLLEPRITLFYQPII